MYDDDQEEEEDFARPKGVGKRTLRQKFSSGLIGLVMMALCGLVLYLLSERNSRTYFIVPEEGELTIKKGRFLPIGEADYLKQNPNPILVSAYAPIEIPGFAAQQSRERFSERSDLDRELAKRLLSWSRILVERDKSTSVRKAVSYLERVTLLPVTSVEQKQVLEDLYREVAFFQGRESLRSAQISLKESLSYFQKAIKAKEKVSKRARYASSVLSGMTKQLEQVVRAIDRPNLALSVSTSSTSTTANQ